MNAGPNEFLRPKPEDEHRSLHRFIKHLKKRLVTFPQTIEEDVELLKRSAEISSQTYGFSVSQAIIQYRLTHKSILLHKIEALKRLQSELKSLAEKRDFRLRDSDELYKSLLAELIKNAHHESAHKKQKGDEINLIPWSKSFCRAARKVTPICESFSNSKVISLGVRFGQTRGETGQNQPKVNRYSKLNIPLFSYIRLNEILYYFRELVQCLELYGGDLDRWTTAAERR